MRQGRASDSALRLQRAAGGCSQCALLPAAAAWLVALPAGRPRAGQPPAASHLLPLWRLTSSMISPTSWLRLPHCDWCAARWQPTNARRVVPMRSETATPPLLRPTRPMPVASKPLHTLMIRGPGGVVGVPVCVGGQRQLAAASCCAARRRRGAGPPQAACQAAAPPLPAAARCWRHSLPYEGHHVHARKDQQPRLEHVLGGHQPVAGAQRRADMVLLRG